MGTVNAIVFDVDGTLLDTRELIRVGYIRTLRDFGYIDVADRFEISTLSKPVRESYKAMLGDDLADSVLESLLSHHENIQNNETDSIVAYEGLHELLASLRAQNRRIGIFTSGAVWHIKRNFLQVGVAVDEAFDAYVTADDPIPRKPQPDGVLLCLERIGDVPVAEALLVGDHAADMLAGKAAGVGCVVGVSHGLGTREELGAAGADHVIDSLADLPLLIQEIEHK